MPQLPHDKHHLISRRNSWILQARKKGVHVTEIATQFNLGTCRVYQILREYGKGSRKGKLQSGEGVKEMLRHYWTRTSNSRREIAKKLGLDISSIRRMARKIRLSKRPQGRRPYKQTIH